MKGIQKKKIIRIGITFQVNVAQHDYLFEMNILKTMIYKSLIFFKKYYESSGCCIILLHQSVLKKTPINIL
jgi:hypothetical protein